MRKKPIKTLLGYVAGIEYNSEGTIIEWLYGRKKRLCSYNESPKIFKTEEQAERFIDSRKHMGKAYTRRYYLYSY